MKHLYVLPALLGCLLSATAQTVPQQAAAAVAPQAPVPPVVYTPLPATGAASLGAPLEDWQGANATVSRYRGHNAILKWERAQAAEGAAPAGRQPAPQEPAR